MQDKEKVHITSDIGKIATARALGVKTIITPEDLSKEFYFFEKSRPGQAIYRFTPLENNGNIIGYVVNKYSGTHVAHIRKIGKSLYFTTYLFGKSIKIKVQFSELEKIPFAKPL